MATPYKLQTRAKAKADDPVITEEFRALFRGWEDAANGRTLPKLQERAKATGKPVSTRDEQMTAMSFVMREDAAEESASALSVVTEVVAVAVDDSTDTGQAVAKPMARPSGIRVVRAGDCARSMHHKICITGLSGSGKTVLGTTVPRGVTIVTEAIAIPTIRQWNPDQGIIEAYTVDHLRDALRWARESGEADGYETVVLDSATEAANIIRRNVVKTSPDRPAMDKAGRAGTMSLGDYGSYAAQVEQFIRAFVALPKHVVALAQAFEIEDEITRMPGIRPAFEGQKFGPRFPGFFQISGVIQNVDTDQGLARQVVLDGPTGQYIVKGGRTLAAIEQPNIAAWIQAMNESE